jgi:hypothetical protein
VVHPPQCAGSVDVSTHDDPHFVAPPLHVSAHAPLLHTRPAVQTVVHVPQCAGSVLVSTHDAPHFVVPPTHESEHAPLLHT